MGMLMSVMGKGVPSLSFLTDTLYDQIVNKDIKEFDDFHIAILDIFSTFNAALPGKHYDVPSARDVEDFFNNKWIKLTDDAEKREKFKEFISEKVTPSKLDEAAILLGIATPPAAMALKRAGENVPQLKMIKLVPDVIFIPSATLITLISLKLTRRVAEKRKMKTNEAQTVGKT